MMIAMPDMRPVLKSGVIKYLLIVCAVVGAVTLYMDGSKSVEGWPVGWAGVRLLGVAPAGRGHGVGRALMDECLRRARAHGVGTIALHTTDLMAVAKAMYERMGFQRAPAHDMQPIPEFTVQAYTLAL